VGDRCYVQGTTDRYGETGVVLRVGGGVGGGSRRL